MKKIIISFLVLIFFNSMVYAVGDEIIEEQQKNLNISDFINESAKYSDTLFDDIDFNDMFSNILKGNIDNSSILKKFISLFGKEFKEAITLLGTVLVIIIINSIFKIISENLKNGGVAQITYYVQYIMITTVILASFSNVLEITGKAMQNLIGFINTLVPLLISLMLITGNIVSAGLIEPILMFMIVFIGNLIDLIIIPILYISVILSVISNISDKIEIDKLSKFLNSGIIWIVGILLTVFVGILSLEGTLSGSIDGITAKTGKAIISSAVPVVGKVLGETVDTIISSGVVLKNALGIFGVIIIISICVLPIIKVAVLFLIYSIITVLIQPLADKNILKLFEDISGTFKIILGILIGVSFILIIGVTLTVKISNSSLMYR